MTTANVAWYEIVVPGALFWFAPLQRKRTRSPSRKVGASAFDPKADIEHPL